MNDHDTRIEQELRDAVRTYGEGVQPADRLGAIRGATSQPPRRARAWWLVGGVAAATGAVVLGLAVLVGPEAGSGGDETPVAAPTNDVTVYEMQEVRGRPWLYPERVTVDDSGDAVHDAVAALIGDSSAAAEDAPWTGCPWGHLRAVDVTDGLVTVSLVASGVGCDIDPAYQEAQLQQVAWTVRDAVGSPVPVRLQIGDDPEPQPMTADPGALSPVLLDSPADGATVESPLTVEGRGNTVEANVQWQVLSGDEVVEEGFETAGTMGDFRPFSFTVDLEPGDYTVRVFEMSMEDGSLFAEDTATITVE